MDSTNTFGLETYRMTMPLARLDLHLLSCLGSRTSASVSRSHWINEIACIFFSSMGRFRGSDRNQKPLAIPKCCGQCLCRLFSSANRNYAVVHRFCHSKANEPWQSYLPQRCFRSWRRRGSSLRLITQRFNFSSRYRTESFPISRNPS